MVLGRGLAINTMGHPSNPKALRSSLPKYLLYCAENIALWFTNNTNFGGMVSTWVAYYIFRKWPVELIGCLFSIASWSVRFRIEVGIFCCN